MSDLVERLSLLRKFLDGSAVIDGASFGEIPDTEPPLAGKYKRRYWWRKHLVAIDEAISTLTPPQDDEGESSTLLHQLKSVTVEKVLAVESMPIGTLVHQCHRAGREIERLSARVRELEGREGPSDER